MIEVLAPGMLTLVQDLGRPGLAALGVSPSGAADAPSLRLSNRLVGNEENAAGLEVTFGGLEVRFLAPTIVALAGAPCQVSVTNTPVESAAQEPMTREIGMNSPEHLTAGAILKLSTPTSGVRTYLAVRGGIAVPLVLGSRSSDVLSGIGPPPLAAGQHLAVGAQPPRWPLVDQAPIAPLPAQPLLHLLPGPRLEWFDKPALKVLCAAPYHVSTDSNRIALRLHGNPVHRTVSDELPPEGLLVGAIQIPPDGQPMLFLADHPTTGGYPVLAIVRQRDVAQAAQLRPGQTVRFATDPFTNRASP